jgi:hypothetical protein
MYFLFIDLATTGESTPLNNTNNYAMDVEHVEVINVINDDFSKSLNDATNGRN